MTPQNERANNLPAHWKFLGTINLARWTKKKSAEAHQQFISTLEINYKNTHQISCQKFTSTVVTFNYVTR
jgi:hypothetical protein